jgi:hypothetical protein
MNVDVIPVSGSRCATRMVATEWEISHQTVAVRGVSASASAPGTHRSPPFFVILREHGSRNVWQKVFRPEAT